MVAFLHALVFLAAAAASPAPTGQLPLASEGKLAAVALLDVGRASPEEIAACGPGATDGLTLVVLVRPIDAPIEVTLSPNVETAIDRQPYQPKAGAGARPQLSALDVEDLFQRRPELASRVPAGFKPHLAILITVPGDTLPESGQVDFAMKAGYHKQIEPFSFTFPLPKKPAPH